MARRATPKKTPTKMSWILHLTVGKDQQELLFEFVTSSQARVMTKTNKVLRDLYEDQDGQIGCLHDWTRTAPGAAYQYTGLVNGELLMAMPDDEAYPVLMVYRGYCGKKATFTEYEEKVGA